MSPEKLFRMYKDVSEYVGDVNLMKRDFIMLDEHVKKLKKLNSNTYINAVDLKDQYAIKAITFIFKIEG